MADKGKNVTDKKTDVTKKNEKSKTPKRRFRFFRDVFAELKKVTWPSRKMLVTYTIAVIVMSLVMAVVLGAWDIGLTKLMDLIVGSV